MGSLLVAFGGLVSGYWIVALRAAILANAILNWLVSVAICEPSWLLVEESWETVIRSDAVVVARWVRAAAASCCIS